MKSVIIKPNEKDLADTDFHILIIMEALIEQSYYCEPIQSAGESFYLCPSKKHETKVLLWPKKANKTLNIIMNQK